jgi:hypothetical protein
MAKDDKKIGSGKGDQLIADQHGKGQQQKGGTAARIHEHKPTPAETAQEEIDDKVFDLKYDLGRSRLYNIRMANKYEKWEAFGTIINLIGGSAVFAEAIKSVEGVALTASLVIVITTTLGLVLKWPEKARTYESLYQQYTVLYERLIRLGQNPDLSDLIELESDFILTEKDEPKINFSVMTMCEQEQCRLMGADGTTIEETISEWSIWRKLSVRIPHPF